jgi:anti-sigma factor RsiW
MTDTQLLHQFAVQNLLPAKYLLGELSGADREDFEQHMFECDTCFESVKAGQVLKQSIAAGISAPRTSWWQRLREFCARTFSNSSEEGQQ